MRCSQTTSSSHLVHSHLFTLQLHFLQSPNAHAPGLPIRTRVIKTSILFGKMSPFSFLHILFVAISLTTPVISSALPSLVGLPVLPSQLPKVSTTVFILKRNPFSSPALPYRSASTSTQPAPVPKTFPRTSPPRSPWSHKPIPPSSMIMATTTTISTSSSQTLHAPT